jgi:hypothetical protein
MSERSQKVLIWWTLIGGTIYGLALGFLLHMIPPPSATWPADRIAEFYTRYNTEIKLGAVVASWTGGFLVPLAVVIAVQVSRLERGRPVWATMTAAGGVMTTIFLTLPPLFFGVAAFTPARAAEITATMHELGLLTLITTDQYYVFMWVAVVVICFTPTTARHSPFPRWFGFFSAWAALMFEAGAIAFLPRTGPFAWNGLLTFWTPFPLFGVWMLVMAYLLLQALTKQSLDRDDELRVAAPV